MNETHPRTHNPWLFRSLAGLGATLRKELTALGWISRKTPVHELRQRDHDVLFVPRDLNGRPDHSTRIAEQVLRCLIYGRYKVSKSQLDFLAGELIKEKAPVHLAVSAEGRHFDRRDFRRWLAQRLAERGVVADEAGSVALWVFCIDQAYYMGLESHAADQVPDRGRRSAELPGSLPPTIAAAMAFQARPAAGERLLDPTCGSGTLLAEAGALQPKAVRVGIDLDADALRAASENLRLTEGPCALVRADATRAPLRDGSVSVFLANLPFGKQFGDRRDNPALYAGLMDEMTRLGNGNWRAVVLTSDLASLGRAIEGRAELASRKLFKVKVRGEWAEAWLLALCR